MVVVMYCVYVLFIRLNQSSRCLWKAGWWYSCYIYFLSKNYKQSISNTVSTSIKTSKKSGSSSRVASHCQYTAACAYYTTSKIYIILIIIHRCKGGGGWDRFTPLTIFLPVHHWLCSYVCLVSVYHWPTARLIMLNGFSKKRDLWPHLAT